MINSLPLDNTGDIDQDIFAFLRDDVPFISDGEVQDPQVPVPIAPVMRLEDILSRDAALRILNLYFHHVGHLYVTKCPVPTLTRQVYGIIPIVHRPSFLASFLAAEDSHSPMFLGESAIPEYCSATQSNLV